MNSENDTGEVGRRYPRIGGTPGKLESKKKRTSKVPRKGKNQVSGIQATALFYKNFPRRNLRRARMQIMWTGEDRCGNTEGRKGGSRPLYPMERKRSACHQEWTRPKKSTKTCIGWNGMYIKIPLLWDNSGCGSYSSDEDMGGG